MVVSYHSRYLRPAWEAKGTRRSNVLFSDFIVSRVLILAVSLHSPFIRLECEARKDEKVDRYCA